MRAGTDQNQIRIRSVPDVLLQSVAFRHPRRSVQTRRPPRPAVRSTQLEARPNDDIAEQALNTPRVIGAEPLLSLVSTRGNQRVVQVNQPTVRYYTETASNVTGTSAIHRHSTNGCPPRHSATIARTSPPPDMPCRPSRRCRTPGNHQKRRLPTQPLGEKRHVVSGRKQQRAVSRGESGPKHFCRRKSSGRVLTLTTSRPIHVPRTYRLYLSIVDFRRRDARRDGRRHWRRARWYSCVEMVSSSGAQHAPSKLSNINKNCM